LSDVYEKNCLVQSLSFQHLLQFIFSTILLLQLHKMAGKYLNMNNEFKNTQSNKIGISKQLFLESRIFFSLFSKYSKSFTRMRWNYSFRRSLHKIFCSSCVNIHPHKAKSIYPPIFSSTFLFFVVYQWIVLSIWFWYFAMDKNVIL
jgi:hypothetical protein